MEQKIKAILAEILEIEIESIDDDFGPENTETWDSLNNLRLITALEDEFSIQFTMDQIEEMTTFRKITETITELSENNS